MSTPDYSRWCIQAPNGNWVNNVLEISEAWAWVVLCEFPAARSPSKLTDRDLACIHRKQAQGYRAVEVRLIPVLEARDRQ